jgi:hypothetical protein
MSEIIIIMIIKTVPKGTISLTECLPSDEQRHTTENVNVGPRVRIFEKCTPCDFVLHVIFWSYRSIVKIFISFMTL